METLIATRLACIVVWSIAALVLLPSAARFMRGQFSEVGELRLALFGTAILLVGGYLGRLFLNVGEVSTLVAINAFTAALGIYVLVVAYQGRAKK